MAAWGCPVQGPLTGAGHHRHQLGRQPSFECELAEQALADGMDRPDVAIPDSLRVLPRAPRNSRVTQMVHAHFFGEWQAPVMLASSAAAALVTAAHRDRPGRAADPHERSFSCFVPP
jgi:hypothetical protein